jgi:hypothetical protein
MEPVGDTQQGLGEKVFEELEESFRALGSVCRKVGWGDEGPLVTYLKITMNTVAPESYSSTRDEWMAGERPMLRLLANRV